MSFCCKHNEIAFKNIVILPGIQASFCFFCCMQTAEKICHASERGFPIWSNNMAWKAPSLFSLRVNTVNPSRSRSDELFSNAPLFILLFSSVGLVNTMLCLKKRDWQPIICNWKKSFIYCLVWLVVSVCWEAVPCGLLGKQKADYSFGIVGLSGFKTHLLRVPMSP